MIYITGDTHGQFGHVEAFCERFQTKRDDILIILGDAGVNFSGWMKDFWKKRLLESLPITIFCIHGNHEQRPETIETYKEMIWQGGMVYYEEEFQHLLFAKDGEVFDLDGKKAIAIGGAYSIDKLIRLTYGYGWWSDEQPSDKIKEYVEQQLEKLDWRVDVVLSHTTPLKYEPVEVFMQGIDQSKVDKSTEIWLDSIEERLNYEKWYCGHYHTKKKVDRLEIMYNNFDVFGMKDLTAKEIPLERILNVIIEKFKLENDVFFEDANSHPNKIISSVPFNLSTGYENNEFELFKSKNEDEKREFVSTGFTIFIFTDIKKNIEAINKINNVLLYPMGYKTTICGELRKIMGTVTDLSLIVFSILHEVGHFYHFIEMGKKPLFYNDYYHSNNADCERRANSFAYKHIPDILNTLKK